MATGKDVARAAGVSTATVTRAFESNSTIREETRRRILQIAKEMHYVPNLNARGLKQQRSRTVGITVKDVGNPFYMNVVTRIEQKLLMRNYRALISFTDRHTRDETSCLETMRASRVDGVVLSPDDARCGHLVEAMRTQGTHFLQLYKRVFPGMDSICNDNAYGAYVGTQHLLDMGHTRILCVNNGDDRTAGYYRALAERGITDCPDPVILDKLSHAEMTAQIRAALDAAHPTAIFSFTNYPTVPVFRLLWDMGIRIPEEISLLVYDDLPWCEMLGISVITHPFDTIAQSTVDHLLSRLEAPEQEHEVQDTIVRPYLLKRHSVRRL